MRPASVERIFATKAALTSRTTRSGDAEVVLAQAILGLLEKRTAAGFAVGN
jgi:hypothetical protein